MTLITSLGLEENENENIACLEINQFLKGVDALSTGWFLWIELI